MNNRKILFVLILLPFLFYTVSFSQYQNIRVSKTSSTDPEEVSIAINPNNPQNLVAGANIKYYYYSFDGGATWDEGKLSTPLGAAGDPCVVFDPKGNIYYGHLSEPAIGIRLDRMVVQKSTDNGISWNDGVGVGLNGTKTQDKEWIAADHSDSDYRGTVYMGWTEFDNFESTDPQYRSRILFSRTTDEGESWSNPITISDTTGICIDGDNALEGANPVVGPDGEVYICWSGHEKITFDISLDGGQTFGTDIYVTDQPGGWDFEIPGLYRCNGMPVLCCDVGNSQYRGDIYLLFADQRNGISNTDIFMTKSTDGGETWGDPVRVNDDDSDRHQFFAWMCIDKVTGYIYVVFYDRRNTTQDATDVYLAKSKDGGSTFENVKISESSFTPNSPIFFGDYSGIAADNGKIYPIWMRMDGNNLSIWMTIIDEPTGIDHDEEKAVCSNFELLKPYTNPQNLNTTIYFQSAQSAKITISLYNIKGKLIKTVLHEHKSAGSHTISWDANSVGAGAYFYKITAGDYSIVRKCSIIK